MGIPQSNIVAIPDPLNGLKMLMAGRAPLMSHIPDVLRFMIKTELDVNPDTLQVKHHLTEGEFYFALSKDELYGKYGLPIRY